MKRLFVSDITKDAEVKDFFLVVKKGIYSSRNNTRYASVQLRDKTGSIEARIWDRVDELRPASTGTTLSMSKRGRGAIRNSCS